jgi:hypothetical protein
LYCLLVYITALLRSPQYLALSQVRAFVNLESDYLPPTLHANIVGTATRDSSSSSNAINDDVVNSPSTMNNLDGMGSDDVGDIRQSIVGSSGGLGAAAGGVGGATTVEDMQTAMRTVDSSDKGKWRKVFMNLRMKIKPHEIAVCLRRRVVPP